MDDETRRAIELSLQQPAAGGEERMDSHESEDAGLPESLLEMAAAMGIPEWKIGIAFQTKDRDADEAVEFMLRHEEEDEQWWRALGGQHQVTSPDLLSALYMQQQQQQQQQQQEQQQRVALQPDLRNLRAQADAEDQYHYTPLMRAAINDDSETVQQLIEDRGATIDKQNVHGTTALMCAAYEGCLRVTETLLWLGASVNLLNESGMSALTIAAQEGHVDVVEKLVARGANKHSKTSAGETAKTLVETNLRHRDDSIPGLLNTRCAHCRIIAALQDTAIIAGVDAADGAETLVGRTVHVTRWWPLRGRYSVTLMDHPTSWQPSTASSKLEEILFEPNHLVIPAGRVVLLEGDALPAGFRQESNGGNRATVVAHDPASGSYTVRSLSGNDELRDVSPEAIRLMVPVVRTQRPCLLSAVAFSQLAKPRATMIQANPVEERAEQKADIEQAMMEKEEQLQQRAAELEVAARAELEQQQRCALCHTSSIVKP
eukprot:COSAG02_NODE_645_length_18947_cov_517.858712_13_plen_488_part_00